MVQTWPRVAALTAVAVDATAVRAELKRILDLDKLPQNCKESRKGIMVIGRDKARTKGITITYTYTIKFADVNP